MSDVKTTNQNEDIMETDMKELKKLQQRLNHDSIKYQFRTKLVGGLNEEDVTKYIENLENKLKKLEQNNNKSSDEIYSLKIKLNMELELKDGIQIELDQVKQDLITAIVEFKQKQLSYKALNDKYNSENLKLKNEIQQIAEDRKSLEKLIAETKLEKEKLQQSASKLIDENNTLKNNISDMAEKDIQITELIKENNHISEKFKSIEKLFNQLKIEYEQLKEISAKFENENNQMKARISDLTEKNIQYFEIVDENKKVTEELKSVEKLYNQSIIECEQLKKISANFENESNQMKAKISELTDEIIHIERLKNENEQLTEEVVAYEELLNQTSIEFDRIMINASKFESENKLLNEEISDLKNNISAKDYKISEITGVCEDLKGQVEFEKSNNEKLNTDSIILKQKISSLQQTINEKLKELDEQKSISENAILELSLEKNEALNYKINGFKEEFSSIYEKMENLEYEENQRSKLISMLKQQLAVQNNRAEKAEDDLAKLIKLLSEVEDKFYSKRDIFGDEFIQQFEKQISKKPTMNSKIINL